MDGYHAVVGGGKCVGGDAKELEVLVRFGYAIFLIPAYLRVNVRTAEREEWGEQSVGNS